MDGCGPFSLANAGNMTWRLTMFLKRRPTFSLFGVPRTKVIYFLSRSGMISRLLASQALQLVPVRLQLLHWPGNTPNSSGLLLTSRLAACSSNPRSLLGAIFSIEVVIRDIRGPEAKLGGHGIERKQTATG